MQIGRHHLQSLRTNQGDANDAEAGQLESLRKRRSCRVMDLWQVSQTSGGSWKQNYCAILHERECCIRVWEYVADKSKFKFRTLL